MERLSALDAGFVDAEDIDRHVSMAIASIAVFEGPAPTFEELCELIAGRLALVPRYQQKLRRVPLRLGAPVWVDDPHFDLRHHLRRTALPAPGGDEQLRSLMARIMAQRLDRDRPLWEYWLVEGLERGCWAMIGKVHHSMVDGVSGTDMYRVLFDLSPEPSRPPVDPRPLADEPSSLALLARSALDSLLLPLADARAAAGMVGHPRRLAQRALVSARGARALAGALRPASPSTLSGRIGGQRRYTWARASMADVLTVKAALGGTLNDVVLAAITSGYRSLLLWRGEQPLAHVVPSLVPVSLRAPGGEGVCDNEVSALVADLPVHLADPLEQFEAVRSRLSALKSDNEAAVGEGLVMLTRYVPYALSSLARLVFRMPQHQIVTVTTNVPGPRQPLYALGRRLVEILPYVPIATTIRTGVAIFSYCDGVTFGITGDYDTTPDLEVLARGIEAGITALVKAATERT
ncbi:wax ester/triacylglycerol synthase family O-acyltransferase [Acidiferrimicrobium sp. IK]|uniref:WS/DGAT/MGAT family O-acyltransferase n=1 Tax=Acidiferrimicrobium sp. IK TaxID=2871700 RepID=UPI0021CB69FF|nr:wax ester/triacylglycerol synthase family O-acyltransferase [Acidiferrimicrobium sp. IK]MCU4187056.1 wax ester/triacylglycerol synthase family O-acyltransferase [Acidiferrimicrobium sp. IK]